MKKTLLGTPLTRMVSRDLEFPLPKTENDMVLCLYIWDCHSLYDAICYVVTVCLVPQIFFKNASKYELQLYEMLVLSASRNVRQYCVTVYTLPGDISSNISILNCRNIQQVLTHGYWQFVDRATMVVMASCVPAILFYLVIRHHYSGCSTKTTRSTRVSTSSAKKVMFRSLSKCLHWTVLISECHFKKHIFNTLNFPLVQASQESSLWFLLCGICGFKAFLQIELGLEIVTPQSFNISNFLSGDPNFFRKKNYLG